MPESMMQPDLQNVAPVPGVRASARMAIQALNNQVLVELQVEPAKSAGGIMLPTAFDDEETEEMMHGICSWLRPIERREEAAARAR